MNWTSFLSAAVYGRITAASRDIVGAVERKKRDECACYTFCGQDRSLERPEITDARWCRCACTVQPSSFPLTMLIEKTFHDIPTKLSPNGRPIRIFVISPVVPDYPQAKFPGVVVFSEIYQVTGPVERFAGQIASQGFVVACPSVYHEFEGPEALPYDTEGTDRGNKYKIEKEVAAYDEDATLSIDLLTSLPNCNGRIASTGMCLGGHLSFRATFDPRVLASVCFFATDIHSATLGKGKSDDSLAKVLKGELTGKGELVMIFGKQDTHVPREGRDLIRKTLEDAKVTVSFLEVQAQHAFVRDEQSKGRWDAALTRSMFTFTMEVFERTVGRDLGPKVASGKEPEHVC